METDFGVISSDYELTQTESRILFVQSRQLIEYRISQDKQWRSFILKNFDPETDTTIPLTSKNIVEYAYLDDFMSLFYLNKKERDYLLVVSEDVLFEQLDSVNDSETESEEEAFVPPPCIVGALYYDLPSKLWWAYYGFICEPAGAFKEPMLAARAVVANYYALNEVGFEEDTSLA